MSSRSHLRRFHRWMIPIGGLSLIGLSITLAPSAASAASVPHGISVKSFTSNFSYMSKLKGLTAAGSGLVGVILPDTTSSTRYVSFDAPYLAQAFKKAGYSNANFKIDN